MNLLYIIMAIYHKNTLKKNRKFIIILLCMLLLLLHNIYIFLKLILNYSPLFLLLLLHFSIQIYTIFPTLKKYSISIPSFF